MEILPRAAAKDRRLVYSLATLQFLVGIAAIGGGLMLVTDPSGASLGLSAGLLGSTPFANFLIPALVLLVVNGLGSIAGGILTLTHYRYVGEIALALGLFLMAWIAVQFWWVREFQWLYVLAFFVGLAEANIGNRLREHS